MSAPFESNRVSVASAVAALINELKSRYGEIMFHFSSGCCEGSAPMCFPAAEFKLGGVDEKVGESSLRILDGPGAVQALGA